MRKSRQGTETVTAPATVSGERPWSEPLAEMGWEGPGKSSDPQVRRPAVELILKPDGVIRMEACMAGMPSLRVALRKRPRPVLIGFDYGRLKHSGT